MYCQLTFSKNAFERLIKYRIADLFRPLSAPVPFPRNAQSWLDGIIATNIDFNRVENDHFQKINFRSSDGKTLPNTAGYGFNAGAIAMEVAVDVFFVRVEDVANAGLNQPPATTQKGLLHIVVRALIAEDGIPIIQLELDTSPLLALGLPQNVVARIADSASATMPFDIGAQLGGMFPAGNDKVLNCGITRDDAGAVVMRFEFPGRVWQSDLQKAAEWQKFFSLGFQANLGDNDWCMDIDGGIVAVALSEIVNPFLRDQKPIKFSPGIESGYIGDTPPRIVLTKNGLAENVCAGNDIRFGAFINLDFTVPSDNLLRGTLSFDKDLDDADVAKCFAITLFNPFSVLITLFDNQQSEIGFATLAFSIDFGLRAVGLLGLAGFLILGFDDKLANKIVEEKLKKNPQVTKLPGGGYAFDRALASNSDFTKDWLVLKNITGSGQRFLLNGKLNVPDAVLPRLTVSDLEGLSKWTLVDSCNPGKGQLTTGSLMLSLTPGYGADRASVQPVKVPTISLKWGVRDDDKGNLRFQILKDTLGIFADRENLTSPQPPGFIWNNSEYTKIYVPGIPGLVEVKLNASTVRKPDFQGFAKFPYPLRLRFFTNGGVREYEFKAPPVFKDFVETQAEAVLRINNCMHRGTSLVMEKYLSLIWLGNPNPDARFKSQLWDVYVHGLEPGRKATVWNQNTGVQLVQAFVNQFGLLDISLILSHHEQADSLLVGLDDKLFIDKEELNRLFLRNSTNVPTTNVEVGMQQIILTQIDRLEFDKPIETIHLAGPKENSVLMITAGDHQFARRLDLPYSAGMAIPTSLSGDYISTNENDLKRIVAWRGQHRQFTVLSNLSGRTEVLAEYQTRSSYDLAVSREDLLAQVSSDGHHITIYQKGVPLIFGTHDWRNVPDNRTY